MKTSIIKFALVMSLTPSAFAQYLDFDQLRNFSDEDQVKLFRGTKVGKCFLEERELIVDRRIFVNPDTIAKRFKAYIKDNQKAMPDEKKFSDKVIAKSLRDVLDDGDCGDYSQKEIENNKKDYPQFLGRLDVGFDYFVAQKTDLIELAKMLYPLKKLLTVHSYEIKELVEAGYTLGELYENGFKIEDMLAQGYNVKDLLNGQVPKKELKTSFTIKEFKDAGVGPWSLKNELSFSAQDIASAGFGIKDLTDAGFDLKKDIKPIFKIEDFKNANHGAWSLKNNIDYTAKEIKDAGFGIKDLTDAGFDLKKDIRPLFKIEDFRKANYGTWSLKNDVGYSAIEIKEAGLGIKDLTDAGFDLNRDLRPLFTAKQFKDASYSAWTLKNEARFSAKELKDAGFKIRELIEAGYSDAEIDAL